MAGAQFEHCKEAAGDVSATVAPVTCLSSVRNECDGSNTLHTREPFR